VIEFCQRSFLRSSRRDAATICESPEPLGSPAHDGSGGPRPATRAAGAPFGAATSMQHFDKKTRAVKQETCIAHEVGLITSSLL
jgi:hypothetical protein